jgi:hypothetical protein
MQVRLLVMCRPGSKSDRRSVNSFSLNLPIFSALRTVLSLSNNGLPLGPLLARVRWRTYPQGVSFGNPFWANPALFFWPNVTSVIFNQYTMDNLLAFPLIRFSRAQWLRRVLGILSYEERGRE